MGAFSARCGRGRASYHSTPSVTVTRPMAEAPTGRRRLVDWLVTPPFLLGFAGALILFDPVIRIASLFGQRPQEYAAGVLQVFLLRVFRLAGTRIEVERDPEVR